MVKLPAPTRQLGVQVLYLMPNTKHKTEIGELVTNQISPVRKTFGVADDSIQLFPLAAWEFNGRSFTQPELDMLDALLNKLLQVTGTTYGDAYTDPISNPSQAIVLGREVGEDGFVRYGAIVGGFFD